MGLCLVFFPFTLLLMIPSVPPTSCKSLPGALPFHQVIGFQEAVCAVAACVLHLLTGWQTPKHNTQLLRSRWGLLLSGGTEF